jgi:hypothetical protein
MSRTKYWSQKLDELKQQLKLTTDVELSFALRVGTGMLSHIRKGRCPVPIAIGADILHRLGYVIDRELLVRLMSRDAREMIAKIDEETGHPGGAGSAVGANSERELPPDTDD